MPRKKKEKPDWYPLDNAGVLYASIQKEKYSAIYRFSAVMTEEVDPAALQRAVDKTMPRFPGFRVRIKQGLFWYYLEPNDVPGPFRPDIANPCQPVRFKEDNGWLVRFYYYRRRISLEVFHALSDGSGALTFFRTLLAVYLRETGVDMPKGGGVLEDISEPPSKEEMEDAYSRYVGKEGHSGAAGRSTAYPNTSEAEPFYTLNVIMGFMPVDKLKEVAKSHGASITEYLAAVLMQAIMENQAAGKPHRPRPVALAIPINLRGWFPSRVLPKLILTVRPCIDPSLGEYTFQEIVDRVHHFMRLNINRQEMRAVFTGNVRFTTNRLLDWCL